MLLLERLFPGSRTRESHATGGIPDAVATDSAHNQRVLVVLTALLHDVERKSGDQVAEVRRAGHVQVVDVDAVEQGVVAHLRDGALGVHVRLHVEEMARAVRETILVLVGQGRCADGIRRVATGRARVGVVRQVVIVARRRVLETKKERLNGVGEVELQRRATSTDLLAVGLLELLDDDIHSIVLVLGALLIGDEHVLSPGTGRANLERLVARHQQDSGEVDRRGNLINPLRGIDQHIGGDVLLHADQVSQIGLNSEVLLNGVQGGAAKGQRVARITSVVVRRRQLDRRGRQRRTERLQCRRVADHLLVQRPLAGVKTVLTQEVQGGSVERLRRQVVERQRARGPDVVRQVPAVRNAPRQQTVAGGVDGDGRESGLHPGHEREVGRLGEDEGRGIVGSDVLHGSEEVGEPGVLLDGTREQRGDVVSSIHERIERVVRRDIDIADSDVCGGFVRHF